MKTRQILYCPYCGLILKNPIYSRVARPCCTDNDHMVSFVIEQNYVLKSSHEELKRGLEFSVQEVIRLIAENAIFEVKNKELLEAAKEALEMLECYEASDVDVDGTSDTADTISKLEQATAKCEEGK